MARRSLKLMPQQASNDACVTQELVDRAVADAIAKIDVAAAVNEMFPVAKWNEQIKFLQDNRPIGDAEFAALEQQIAANLAAIGELHGRQ